MNSLLYFGKIAIRKRTLVSLNMGTSTGIALPRTSIGNLRVWVPTYRTITTVSSTIGFRIFLGYSFGQARDIPKLLADI